VWFPRDGPDDRTTPGPSGANTRDEGLAGSGTDSEPDAPDSCFLSY
jgi:hypothetical protein